MTVPQRIAAQVDSVTPVWSARPIRSDIPAERVVGAEFSAQRVEPDLVWVGVRGEIDIRNAHALHAFTHRQLEEAVRMVVDLAAVEFFGAAGLSVFDDLDERARALNVRWVLLSGRPVERLLRIADADLAAKACRTREAALAAVAPVT
ncbi:STAS domain-containing protein [Rhodococcus gordoniae]